MNPVRIWRLLYKDLALGPRKPAFLYAVVLPVALTLILQVAFGTLFEPQPRMGVVDAGESEITAELAAMEGIQFTRLDNPEELKTRVEQHDLDAGLILKAGFDEAVRAGERPELELFVSGESLASDRIILGVTTIDLIRAVEGAAALVAVEVVTLGEEGLPLSLRLIPLIMFYALVMAGVFVPASSLVEEKENSTLQALLVSPVTTGEILAAKWWLGLLLSSIMALVTLFLNRALGPHPWQVLAVVVLAAALTAMLGLLVGVVSRTSTILFTIVKSAGVILFAPVVFYLFPDWPQWIAQIFPLYWIIEPIWQVSVMGGTLDQVWFELTIASGITLALVPLVVILGRRMPV